VKEELEILSSLSILILASATTSGFQPSTSYTKIY